MCTSYSFHTDKNVFISREWWNSKAGKRVVFNTMSYYCFKPMIQLYCSLLIDLHVLSTLISTIARKRFFSTRCSFVQFLQQLKTFGEMGRPYIHWHDIASSSLWIGVYYLEMVWRPNLEKFVLLKFLILSSTEKG